MKGTIYVPVSDDGRLESIARPDRVSDADMKFIRQIVDRVSGMMPDKRMAVYLRGSLAYGGFLEGISDLDMVIFADSFSPDERTAVSCAADEFTRMSADRYSLVDISCVEAECLCRPEWNRLYLNIALTGMEVFNNGLALSYPQPMFSEALARRIAAQTETDCKQTLADIASGASFEYMGRPRSADFLCVWFARDYLRGLIAFVMQKECVFSLHLETCAYEFCRCFPQYRAITEKIFMAERHPISDRQALERLAFEALTVYSGLSAEIFKGETATDDKLLIATDTLLADVYAGKNGVYHGRVTKKFDHKRVCLFQLLCGGQRLKAVIRKGTTENYELIRDAISPGTAVCGIGRPVLNPRNETEIEFSKLYLVRENLHKGNDSGLVSGSKFTKNDMKRYFHTYLCDNELCTLNIAARGAVFSGLRHGLEERGYVECTTPMLTRNFYGGGSQPFVTHMLDNGADMYLRVSSEIAMKHIIGGGFDRVYEIGPSFRNGSVSAKYATPFYCAEIYTAYCTEQDNIKTAIALMRCIETSLEKELERIGAEKKISFLGDIPTMSFEEYYLHKTGSRFDPRLLTADCVNRSENSRQIYKQLKNELITDQISPILITDLPSGSSPLIAKKSESSLRRSYLVANGATISECAIGCNDPGELSRQFGLQDGEQEERYKRDHEPFLHLYESGMPPVGSIFIGIDRIVPAFLGIDNINDYLMSM